jgi:hypothetical protein
LTSVLWAKDRTAGGALSNLLGRPTADGAEVMPAELAPADYRPA